MTRPWIDSIPAPSPKVPRMRSAVQHQVFEDRESRTGRTIDLEARRRSRAAPRRAARSAVCLRRRSRRRRGDSGRLPRADVPPLPDRSGHRARRPARDRCVEPARLRHRRRRTRRLPERSTTIRSGAFAVASRSSTPIRGSTPPPSRWTTSTRSVPSSATDSINLWGGSYGTRAALVYLKRHEASRPYRRARRRRADRHASAACTWRATASARSIA